MFDDPMFIEDFDEENSTSDESRFRGIGQINGFVIVASCYTHRNGRIRIINARRATPKERHYYEQRYRGFFHTLRESLKLMATPIDLSDMPEITDFSHFWLRADRLSGKVKPRLSSKVRTARCTPCSTDNILTSECER